MYFITGHPKNSPKGVGRLRTDGGTENKPISNVLEIFTASHTSQQNPFGKPINRTILEPARTILEEAGLGRKYWSYAVEHITYVKNRLPHSTLECNPFGKLTAKFPSLGHVRVFGCAAFVYNSAPPSKFHAKATPGIYLGVDDHGVYAVETIPDRRLQYSMHITFDESSFPALLQEESSFENDNSVNNSSTYDSSNNGDLDLQEVEVDILDLGGNASDEDLSERRDVSPEAAIFNSSCNQNEDSHPAICSRPRRNHTKPTRYVSNVRKGLNCKITTSDTPTVEEAMNSTEQEIAFWKAAIETVFENLASRGTWSPEKAPTRSTNKPLTTHVILKIKRDQKGNVSRFTARVVAGTNLQREGINFDSVNAPVVDFTLTLLTALVCLSNN